MSVQRVGPFQRGSVHQRCCVDGSERARESLASRAGKNLKTSTIELGGSDAPIAPAGRAQTWGGPERAHTIGERVPQPFWEPAKSTNAAPADPFQSVASQLLAFFRAQGCVLPVAEELAQKVTGELTARVREVLRRPGLGASWISGVIQVGDLKLDLQRRMLWRLEDEIHLSPKEFDLLALMMKHSGVTLSHVKLLRQIRGRLVDAAMIRDHALRKFLYVFGIRLGFGEVAGIDIHLIRGNDDGGNLRVGGACALSPGGADAQRNKGQADQ